MSCFTDRNIIKEVFLKGNIGWCGLVVKTDENCKVYYENAPLKQNGAWDMSLVLLSYDENKNRLSKNMFVDLYCDDFSFELGKIYAQVDNLKLCGSNGEPLLNSNQVSYVGKVKRPINAMLTKHLQQTLYSIYNTQYVDAMEKTCKEKLDTYDEMMSLLQKYLDQCKYLDSDNIEHIEKVIDKIDDYKLRKAKLNTQLLDFRKNLDLDKKDIKEKTL